jgi:hypothetical protein
MTETIQAVEPPCPLDHAILKLLIAKRRTVHSITHWLKLCGRDTDTFEVREYLRRLHSCGRVLTFVPPHESRDATEVFALSNAGFEALTAFLRASSRTETNPYGKR